MPAVLVRTVHSTLYSSFKYILPSYADADYGLCLQYLLVCTLYSSFKYILFLDMPMLIMVYACRIYLYVHCTLYSSFKYIVPRYADADYGLCLQYLLVCTLYIVHCTVPLNILFLVMPMLIMVYA